MAMVVADPNVCHGETFEAGKRRYICISNNLISVYQGSSHTGLGYHSKCCHTQILVSPNGIGIDGSQIDEVGFILAMFLLVSAMGRISMAFGILCLRASRRKTAPLRIRTRRKKARYWPCRDCCPT